MSPTTLDSPDRQEAQEQSFGEASSSPIGNTAGTNTTTPNNNDKFSTALEHQRLRFSNMLGKAKSGKRTPLKRGGESGKTILGKYAPMEDDPQGVSVENYNQDDHDGILPAPSLDSTSSVSSNNKSSKKIANRFKKMVSQRQQRKQQQQQGTSNAGRGVGRFGSRFGISNSNRRFVSLGGGNDTNARSLLNQSESNPDADVDEDAWNMSDEEEVVEGVVAESPKKSRFSPIRRDKNEITVIRPSPAHDEDDSSSNSVDDSISSNSSSSVASSDLQLLKNNNSKSNIKVTPSNTSTKEEELEKAVNIEDELEDLRNEIENIQNKNSHDHDDDDDDDSNHENDESQSPIEEIGDSSTPTEGLMVARTSSPTQEVVVDDDDDDDDDDSDVENKEQLQTESNEEDYDVLSIQKGVIFGQVARRINCVCGRGEKCYDVSATFFDANDPRSGYTLLPKQIKGNKSSRQNTQERHRRELFLNHLVMQPKTSEEDKGHDESPSFDEYDEDDGTEVQYIANHHFHPKVVSESSRELVCQLPVCIPRESMFRLQMGLTAKEKVMDEEDMPTGEYYLCPNYDFDKATADSLRVTRVKRAVEANCKVSTDKLVVPVLDHKGATTTNNSNNDAKEEGDDTLHTQQQSLPTKNDNGFSTPPRAPTPKLTLATNNISKEKEEISSTATFDENGEMMLPKYEVSEEARLRLYSQMLEVENKRRKEYGPRLYCFENEWQFSHDVLNNGLKELVQAEKFITQLARSQKIYADSMKAIYEDVFLDDSLNVAGSWKHGILSNRRMNQDYTQILEGRREASPTRDLASPKSSPKSSLHGNGNSPRKERPEERTGMLCPLIDTTSILAEEFGDCAMHSQQTACHDVTTYREKFQSSKEELDKLYGKSIIGELERAEYRVEEAWSAFHTNINTSCNATVFFNSPGSPSDMLIPTKSFDSKDPHQKSDGKFLLPGSLRRAFSKETDNGKDLWLLEMKYYLAVLNQRQAWEGTGPELSKLHAAVAKLEAERQEKIHSILLAYLPRQRRLSSNCASVHKPVLNQLVNVQMEEKVEEDVKLALRNHTRTLQEGGTAHRSRFINRSRRQDDIIGGFEAPTGFEVLDSPISSSTLASMRIIERRVRTVTGYQGWQTTLAITTVDGFIHLFDLPDGVDTSVAPEKAFYSLWPALPTSENIKEKKPAGRKLLSGLMPAVSLFVPHCSASIELEPSKQNEFEIIESSQAKFGRFGVPKTRQVLLRTRTVEEAQDFINTNLEVS